MNDVIAGRFVVPADHPSLPGHFPARPIVPAVVLLEAVLSVIPASESWFLQSVPAAKFLQPVLPGDPVELRIELTAGTAGELLARFRGSRAETTVFEGMFLFARTERPA